MSTVEKRAASSIVLLGFVEAGKSTYLAAMYHIAERSRVPGALRLTGLERDLEYVTSLHQRWLACERLPRTSGLGRRVVSLQLQADDSEGWRLEIPDPSGEGLEQSLADRKWETWFDEMVSTSMAFLLFINPTKVVEPAILLDAQRIVDDLDRDSSENESDDSDAAHWSPKQAPSQIKIVDLLQTVVARSSHKRLRLAVVVSAWDTVDWDNPSKWMADRLPLLDQFLHSNLERLDFRCYGISAQGGAIPEARERLLSINEPGDRVEVVGGSGDRRDLTQPLRWLLSPGPDNG
jgi:hypothetical protein